MSVSHAPSFPHSQPATQRRTRTAPERRHRATLVLGGMGLFLLAWFVAGFVGLAFTDGPLPGPSTGYNADGSNWVNTPSWAVLWLGITMMAVVGMLAYGIATAAHNQQ